MPLHSVPLIVLLCAALAGATAAPAAATVTPALQGSTLTLTGDGADDDIAIKAAGLNLAVDLNDDGVADAAFPAAGVSAVVVNAGGGDDTVAGSGGVAIPLTVNGQDGADSIVGGDGPDDLSGGDGPDQLSGARGTDVVSGDAGADRFVWSPGEGSDTLNGGSGSDLHVFNGANLAEIMSLTPNGARATLFRDIGNVTQDMGGIESLDVRMFAGANTFTSGPGVAAVLPTVRVLGGSGVDTFTGGDEADEMIGGPGGLDVINTGAGDDTIPLGLTDGGDTIDAGPGTDTLAVTGSDAGETYTIGVPAVAAASVSEANSGASLSSLNTERVRIEALGGNDTTAMQVAATTALTVDLRGGDGDDVLGGGSGTDVLRGGSGADRLDGAGGNDALFGDAGDDLLLGRTGADAFACGGLGDVLDATAEDTVGADCLPPAPPAPPVAAPAVTQPAAADTVAPVLTLRGVPATVTRAALLRRGLRFTVAPSEASAVDAELLGRARGASIAAAAPNLTLARRALGRASGARTITLRPSARLVGRARRFSLTLRITATDAAGNRRTVTRTVRVR